MELFKKLYNKTSIKDTIAISITRTEKGFIVTTAHKAQGDDKALSQLPMLTLQGSPEELDNSFVDSIDKPIERTFDLAKEIQAHEAKVAEAKKNSDMMAAEKKKKKDATDKAIKKLEALKEKNEWEKILKYTFSEDANKDDKKIKAIIEEATKETSKGQPQTLF